MTHGLRGTLCLLLVGVVTSAWAAEPTKIDFDRQIRPILSNHCYRCHGPDAGERQAEFRLDQRDSAIAAAESGAFPIAPGNAAKSELLARINHADADVVMPPPAINKPLTAAQKELLTRWIEAGAPYSQHWAFVPPQRPALPAVKKSDWPQNPVDHFILARLESEQLAPSAPAERTALIRRVTFDLTGLPPTAAEIAAFLADDSPRAYEKVVDRLLNSPHYGERLAVDWLDAARFADTHGYHIDSGRDMSRWREWVIDSFNQNLPFDRFTVEQLAGDLLPDATLEQKVASGFNRNHMINFEGGASPQEYHNAYIVDRVSTTSTVWLGLTMACAQCHDHKYDPLSQKEFYQFYSFFYNVPENGLDGSKGNAAPLVKAPTRSQQEATAKLTASIKELEAQLAADRPELAAEQAAWESTALVESTIAWTALAPVEMNSRGGGTFTKQDDNTLLVTGKNPATDRYTITADIELEQLTALRLETGVDDKLTGKGPGRSVNGNMVLTDVKLKSGATELPLAAASADFSQQDYPVANAIDNNRESGWAIYPEVGKPHAATFELAKPFASAGKSRITIELAFETSFAQHQLGVLRLSVTNAKDPRSARQLPAPIIEALKVAKDQRRPAQLAAIQRYFREHESSSLTTLRSSLATAKQDLAAIDKSITSTMVMQEMNKPREAHLLMRGAFDKPGEKVTAGVPAILPPLAEGQPSNRLGLANWLVDKQHPLTARVIVNRYWQLIFGTGLVKTVEDLGSQGEQPSHPELLDYLAVEFVSPERKQADGSPLAAWDVKALLRMFVTSAAYRQSANVSPELFSKDPENRLLARGPRHRLQAEFIRDQALFASGLLNRQIGGKSVTPYQPAGLWSELASRADGKNWTAQEYEQSHGADLYRRTMYTFWKRTSPPPQLSTFDAPDRETCTVRRLRTNTPLQALILLNDPTYVEASRKLAERMMKEGGETPEARFAFAFELATSRKPAPREVAILRRVYEQQLAKFTADPTAADKLLAVGEAPRDEKLPAIELASYGLVASLILNLDEAVTK
ncbi:MAG TPA: PSD1 and planctomycete cytochrome C domain-containing protein [Pirellulaceae bacterium]|nr:PSD1 and planctomycete cytochrome C domain-containing protein [Pirellulaceae bacterium]